MKLKMLTQSPSDRNRVTWLPSEIAWYAARGIACDTHHAVILYGQFGTARFHHDGSGFVEWNEQSTRPGLSERFAADTIVCI